MRVFGRVSTYGSTVPRSPGPDPRDWLLDAATRKRWQRTGFGVEDVPGSGWKEPQTAQERALVAAAKNHQRLAMHIRSRMLRRGLSAEEMADKLDMSVDYLLDILSGSTHVYLTDLHRIASIFDIEFYGAFTKPKRDDA